MKKKLTKSGNSYAIVIDRAVMDLLNITPDTTMEISTNGRSIIATPIGSGATREEVDAAFEWASKKYGGMLRRLAE